MYTQFEIVILMLKIKRKLGSLLRSWEEKKYISGIEKKNVVVPEQGIYLSYARQNIPDVNGLIHGGRVKLTHLAEMFPESDAKYNILYLVSSAIPAHAEALLKHLKKRGVKFVWNQNGVAYPAWDNQQYLQTNLRLASLLHQANFVVYQSEFCKLSADHYLGRANVPWKVIYNPVDTELFSPAERPPSLDCWQLLVAGTHLQSERVLLILRTLAELKKQGHRAKLTVAGRLAWSGAEQETADVIRELGLVEDVEMLGSFTQTQAPAIYRAAHILFHIKYKDPCPTVPIEAMASGVPVIGSLSGGMPELVSDEGGVLLNVPDVWDKMCYPLVDDLAGAVKVIMSDYDGWSDRARKQSLQRFTREYWLEQHRQIFIETLA